MLSRIKKFIRGLPVPYKKYIREIYLLLGYKKNGAKSLKKIKFFRNKNTVAVLGNGPSLKTDKLHFESLIETHDFVCVNNFCDDDLYEKIKPNLYIFLDEYFYNPEAHEDWIARREKTFSILNAKTSWPMQIFLPAHANTDTLKAHIDNKNIEIVKINVLNLYAKKFTKSVRNLFNLGVYGPPQTNVLVYAIYLSIWAGYKSMDIYGADLSFHKDVSVDQKTNELVITFRHFNLPNEVEVLRKNPQKIVKWEMAEFLDGCAVTFYAHELLNEYAKYKNVAIKNKSNFSLIDAYARV